MGKFWILIDSNQLTVQSINDLIKAGENPHEPRQPASGDAQTPLSYLVSQGKTEIASAILEHPDFDFKTVEIAYFIHVTLDKILNTDNAVFQTLISEQMKNDLQLDDILNTYPTVDELKFHLEPIVRHLSRMTPAQRKQYSKNTKIRRFIDEVLALPEGASIDLQDGLDYDEVINYQEGQETMVGTALSVMIRKGLDANALILLSNSQYQFFEGSLYALRAAVRMKKGGLVDLLKEALLNGEYRFNRSEITANLRFFVEQGETAIAVEMMSRAKDITSPLNEVVDLNPGIFSNQSVQTQLRTSRLYTVRGYKETPCPLRIKNGDFIPEDNVSEPDSEYGKNGRFAL